MLIAEKCGERDTLTEVIQVQATGIDHIKANDVRLFPNPASSVIYLQAAQDITQIIAYRPKW